MRNESIRGFDLAINLPGFQLPNTASLLQPEHVDVEMALLANARQGQVDDCFAGVRLETCGQFCAELSEHRLLAKPSRSRFESAI